MSNAVDSVPAVGAVRDADNERRTNLWPSLLAMGVVFGDIGTSAIYAFRETLHNHSLHERVIFLTVATQDVPYVDERDRIQLQTVGDGVHRLILRFGFAEDPDVPSVLSRTKIEGRLLNPMDTTFFLGTEHIVPT